MLFLQISASLPVQTNYGISTVAIVNADWKSPIIAFGVDFQRWWDTFGDG